MHAGDYLSSFPSLLKPQSPGAVAQEPVLPRQVVLRARAEPEPGLTASSHPTPSHHKRSYASPPSLRWSEHDTSANPGLWEPGNPTAIPTSLLSGECLASAMRCWAQERSQPFPPPHGGCSRDCAEQRQTLLPWGPELASLCLCSHAAHPPTTVTCNGPGAHFTGEQCSGVSRRPLALGDAPGARTHIHSCSFASTPPWHPGLGTAATSEQ